MAHSPILFGASFMEFKRRNFVAKNVAWAFLYLSNRLGNIIFLDCAHPPFNACDSDHMDTQLCIYIWWEISLLLKLSPENIILPCRKCFQNPQISWGWISFSVPPPRYMENAFQKELSILNCWLEQKNLYYCSERGNCVSRCKCGVWSLRRFEVALYIVWRGVCMHRTSRYRAGWSSSLLEEGCLHSSIQVESQVAKLFPIFPALFEH